MRSGRALPVPQGSRPSGNAFDAVAKPESFSLLYLNPPYDSEIGSLANRRMEAVFLEHTYRWLAMEGVLVLVIPSSGCTIAPAF